MPVYNAERYVAAAVESILGQTYGDFEFIIIDDGSADGSLGIVQYYADRDNRISLVSRPNAGVGKTRNEALGMARGEYFAVMDADDVSLSERFARQVEHLRKTSDCVALGSRVLLIDPDGAPIREWSQCESHEEIDGAHMMGKGGAITHPASMIRRDAIVALSGYREDLAPAEDYDLFLRLAEQGRLANLPDMLLQYRQHLTSFGYTQRKRQQQAAQIALKEAHNRRGLEMRCNVEGPVVGDRREPDHHLKWAWWALQAGNVATARKHAFTALRKSPLSGRSWKTMLCAVRGF